MSFPKKAICQSVGVTVCEIIAGDQRKNVTTFFLSGFEASVPKEELLYAFFFFFSVPEAQYLSVLEFRDIG